MTSRMKSHVASIELHLTNRCNIAKRPPCVHTCTYNALHSVADTLPFEYMYQVARLQPTFLFFAGGGEPTLYRDGSKDFVAAVSKLRELIPTATFVLSTNGVYIPRGMWQDQFAAIRIGLHGFDPRKPVGLQPSHAQKTWSNIWRYLDSGVGEVVVNYLITRESATLAVDLAERIWVEWDRRYGTVIGEASSDGLESQHSKYDLNNNECGRKNATLRLRLQYLADDSRPGHQYWKSEPDDQTQVEWAKRIRASIDSDRPFGTVLRHITLGMTIPGFSLSEEFRMMELKTHTLSKGNRCLPATDFVLLGASGKLYPCCAMAATEWYSYGSVRQSLESLSRKRQRLAEGYVVSEYCSNGCRFNYTFVGRIRNIAIAIAD